MNTAFAAGVLLIVLPLAFNAAFATLAAKFDYPDILRKPTQEILHRFRDGGSGLVLLWWSFGMTAVLLAPAAVLLSGALAGVDSTLLALGSASALCSLEFVGSFEPNGWKLAAALTPVTYIVWSLWLVAVGVFLLL